MSGGGPPAQPPKPGPGPESFFVGEPGADWGTQTFANVVDSAIQTDGENRTMKRFMNQSVANEMLTDVTSGTVGC